MTINPNVPFHTVVGDRQKALGRTLYNGQSVANLTDLTLAFKMVDKDGNVIVNWEAATVVSALAGTLKYSFAANDVDTAGKYYGWFRTTDGSGLTAHYPADHYGIPIFIHTIGLDESY